MAQVPTGAARSSTLRRMRATWEQSVPVGDAFASLVVTFLICPKTSIA
jgi:hypothetical protein